MPFLKRGTCTVGLKMVSTFSSQDSGVNLWKNNNQMTSTEFVEISVTVLFTTLTDHCTLLELLINHISMLIQTPSLRTSVYWNLMISICFNLANLCILAKIHSYLQGLITISPKAINSTLTIQEIPRPTVYRIVVQTLRSSRPFFKGLSFLIHLTTRSSTLNPFPLLRKNWRLNYWVNMKTVHKSFHLGLFAIFSLLDVKQL